MWNLTTAQLRMYLRDRQSVFFALFFPLFFMLALGFVAQDEIDPIDVAIVRPASTASARTLFSSLEEHALVDVTMRSKEEALLALEEGEHDLVLFPPDSPIDPQTSEQPIPLSVMVNAASPQRTQQALTILSAVLTGIEHDVRNTGPLFNLEVQDVRTQTLRYIDFLVPGLLAFMVLQLSIAGSGFNIVEYKRKGILKRLFVTPLRPVEFIVSLIATRLLIIVVQISLLLVVAELVFDISIQGSVALLYFFVLAGSIAFLGLGFALGGIAKTQSAVMAIGNLVIFPQVFVAGVFFPIDSLPAWVQPVAALLPLNFVSDALRQVANDGAALTDLGVDLLGLAAWIVIGVLLAVRFFHWSEAATAPMVPR